MKRRWLFFLSMVCLALYATTQPVNDTLLRDSLFRIYRSMPADTLRTEFLRNAFIDHIGRDWSSELLDSALVSAIRMKDAKSEVKLRYEYFRYHTFRMDGENMEKTLNLLKEACYRHEMYEDYFLALHYFLQLKGTEGNTEYALLESQKMYQEAVRLKVPRGEFIAHITEGKTYMFARNYDKAVNLYQKALKIPQLTREDRLLAHNYLASTCYLMEKYKETLGELEEQRKIIDTIIQQQPTRKASYRKKILEIELMYCKIYLAECDTHKLKKHLDEAAKYYTADSFSSIHIAYHFSWAGYYYLMKDWDKCFPQFQLTLSFFKGSQPMYEADIRRVLGEAYRDAGRYREAAETFRSSVLKQDSINKATLRMNAETVQANYRIKKALLEKEIAIKHIWQVAVSGGVLFILLLDWGILRLCRIRRELAKSEKEMRESYALVDAADKMKEVFLHNITNEIREPLNLVVTLSDKLCQSKDLTAEEKQEYSVVIKRNASKLIDLIFNILDLSRLEAGMMKFNIQENDVVQLCRDAKLMVEMHEGNTTRIDFRTELESLTVAIDSFRFMKLLSSVLMPPKESEEAFNIDFTLMCEDDECFKIIIVKNSPLFYDEDHKEYEILHSINRLYLETFKGSYQSYQEDGKQMIVITYPLI